MPPYVPSTDAEDAAQDFRDNLANYSTPVTAADVVGPKAMFDAFAPYLSSGGTVTSITAGTGLTGGTITTSGTIAADFGTSSGKVTQGNDSRLPPAPSTASRNSRG